MMEDSKPLRRNDWWWLVLIASSVLWKDMTSGWAADVVFNIGSLVGYVLLPLGFGWFVKRTRPFFAGSQEAREDKQDTVRTAAIASIVFTLMSVATRVLQHTP